MRPLPTSIISSPAGRRWAPVVVVTLPIAVAAVRAAVGDWVPIGDDAYFTVRSRDVLTEHHPLLGAWSSGSFELENPINNLGPVQLDLLAPFTRLAPYGGTAIGVAVTNIAAVVAIAWLVARAVGERAVLPVMCAVALLTWTMGSEMLITPRQHQYLILPYLCLLVAAWAAINGDRWAIAVAVVAGSVCAQTHLSYPVLVAALALAIAAGHVAAGRRGEASGGRRPLVAGAGLAVLLWSQTLVEQVFGDGNLGHVLFGSGEAGRAGLTTGARIVAGTLVSTDTLLRPGYRRSDGGARLAAPWQSIVFWIGVAAVMVVVGRALRAGRHRQAAGWLVAAVALVAGVIDAALLPPTEFGLAIGNYRWLWATGALLAMLVMVEIRNRTEAGSAAAHRAPWVPRITAAGAVVLCVVPAVANLATSVQSEQAAVYVSQRRTVADVLAQADAALDGIEVDGPVVIDESEMYFGHPFTYPLLVLLQQHAVEFRFESLVQERRFGERRLADGSERRRLRLVSGDAATGLGDAPGLLAHVPGERPLAIVLEDD